MLDLDASVLMVFALIWILMVILNRLFFRPVGKVIGERETKIERDNREIERLSKDLEIKTQRIEIMLREAQKESALLREELIRKGEKAKEQIVTAARDQAKELFNRKMAELEQEIEETEQKMISEIASFSKQIREIFV
jgi:F-type H+-transporting ATPase subunit b